MGFNSFLTFLVNFETFCYKYFFPEIIFLPEEKKVAMGCTALQHRARTGMFAGALRDGRRKKESKIPVTNISLRLNILNMLKIVFITASVMVALTSSAFIFVMLDTAVAGGQQGVSVTSTPYAGLASALVFLPMSDKYKFLSGIEISDKDASFFPNPTLQIGWKTNEAESKTDWAAKIAAQADPVNDFDLESEQPVKAKLMAGVSSGWSPGLVKWWAGGGGLRDQP